MAEQRQADGPSRAAQQQAEEHNRAGRSERAKDEPLLTEHQDLGLGVVRTPGHPIETTTRPPGPVFSDRVIDNRGRPAPHPTLSTYEGPSRGVEGGTVKADVPEGVVPPTAQEVG
jgi:hypothetical protein